MPRSSAPAAEKLLHVLLDRFEAPKLRLRDITLPIDYNQIGGPAGQDECHRVLEDAERTGGVSLERERIGRFTGEYARIRLVDATKLYAFLERRPADSIAAAARVTLRAIIPDILKETFFAKIENEAVEAWKANKSFLGFTAGNVDGLATVLRLTHAIVHFSGRDIDHRTFSRRTVKDSKALEHCEARVAQLVKRRFPDLTGDEPREILEACGIVRRAHLLQVRGPLLISSDALTIRGAGEAFIGLPWTAAQQTALSRPVDYVLTVENPTSFWRFCTEIPGNYLALLTDGFPARDVLSGIVHLVTVARAASGAPLYHWGDIDAGGLRIAAHLEDALGQEIGLHEMTPALAFAHGTPLLSRKGLDRLVARDGDIGALARWLSGDQARGLEQEELDPKAPSCPVSDLWSREVAPSKTSVPAFGSGGADGEAR